MVMCVLISLDDSVSNDLLVDCAIKCHLCIHTCIKIFDECGTAEPGGLKHNKIGYY
jgi:hypothetical protein